MDRLQISFSQTQTTAQKNNRRMSAIFAGEVFTQETDISTSGIDFRLG